MKGMVSLLTHRSPRPVTVTVMDGIGYREELLGNAVAGAVLPILIGFSPTAVTGCSARMERRSAFLPITTWVTPRSGITRWAPAAYPPGSTIGQ